MPNRDSELASNSAEAHEKRLASIAEKVAAQAPPLTESQKARLVAALGCGGGV